MKITHADTQVPGVFSFFFRKEYSLGYNPDIVKVRAVIKGGNVINKKYLVLIFYSY